MQNSRCCSYLRPATDNNGRVDIVEKLVHAIERNFSHIDAIAITGYSGALIAPIVSFILNIPLVAVRKNEDGSHSPFRVESGIKLGELRNYVIIDDLIASGSTVKRIMQAIDEITSEQSECEAILLYNDPDRCTTNIAGIPVYYL